MATKTETNLRTNVGNRYLLTFLAKDAAVLEQVRPIVEEYATVEKSEDLGVRKLFFPIQKQSELTLLSIFLRADSVSVKKLEQRLRSHGSILRFILTRWNAEIEKSDRTNKKQTTVVAPERVVHV